ncbi:hypothetical protein CLOM_g16273 [Closterium sp. NIES-68]|nr:hypothetical protein CLOM_g16273 [Closterium sp. NIES-68]
MYKPRGKANKAKHLHHSDGARGWPPEEPAASAAGHSSGDWSGTAEAMRGDARVAEAVGGMAVGGMGAGGMPVSSPDVVGKSCFNWRGVFHKDHGARVLKLEGGGVAEVLVVDAGCRDDEVRMHHEYSGAGFSGGQAETGMAGAFEDEEAREGCTNGSDRVGARGESMAGVGSEQERAVAAEPGGVIGAAAAAAPAGPHGADSTSALLAVSTGGTHDLSVRTDDTVSSAAATVGSVSSARLSMDGVSSRRVAGADGAGTVEAVLESSGGGRRGEEGSTVNGTSGSPALLTTACHLLHVTSGPTLTTLHTPPPSLTPSSLTRPPNAPSLPTHPETTTSSSSSPPGRSSSPLPSPAAALSAASAPHTSPLDPPPTISPSLPNPSAPQPSAPDASAPSAPPPRPHTAAASSLPRPSRALPPTPASRGSSRGARGGVSREGRSGTGGGGSRGGSSGGFHARKLSTDDSFLGLSSFSPLDASTCTARTPRLSPRLPAAAAALGSSSSAAGGGGAAAPAAAPLDSTGSVTGPLAPASHPLLPPVTTPTTTHLPPPYPTTPLTLASPSGLLGHSDTATSPSIIHKSPSTPSVSTDDELAPLPGLGIAGAGLRRNESVGSSSGSVMTVPDDLAGLQRPGTLKTWKSVHSHSHRSKLARGLLFGGAAGEGWEEGVLSPRGSAFMAAARRRGLWRRTVTPKESVKRLLMWPQAGSQVSRCTPGDSSAENSWSPVDPASFDVRGETFLSDRRKVPASPPAIYEPWGVDVFHTPLKIRHVAEHVELPASLFEGGGGGESGEVRGEGMEGGEGGQGEGDGCMDGVCEEVYGVGEVREEGVLPGVLVVNLQVPLYTALPLLQQEQDGEGISLVLYFKLSAAFSQGLPPCLAPMLEPLCQPPAEPLSPLSYPQAEHRGTGTSGPPDTDTARGSARESSASVAAVAGSGMSYSAADADHSRTASKGSGAGSGSSTGAGARGRAAGASESGRKESPNAFKWDRPKLLARVVNEAGMGLGSSSKKAVQSWSGQPILTRSHHSLIRGESKPYVEMDIDVHRFPNQVKRGLLPLRRHLSSCVFDIAIILQGVSPEEFPEPILACVRLHRLDLSQFGSLGSGL